MEPRQGDVHFQRDCYQLCAADEGCTGFEARPSDQRCELWREAIVSHRHVFHHRSVKGALALLRTLCLEDLPTLSAS